MKYLITRTITRTQKFVVTTKAVSPADDKDLTRAAKKLQDARCLGFANGSLSITQESDVDQGDDTVVGVKVTKTVYDKGI